MDWIPLTSTKSEKDLQPKKFRKKWYRFWEKSGFLNPLINLKKHFPL